MSVSRDRYFFFNDTATTEIYTLSLHDALPILGLRRRHHRLWRERLAPLRRRRDLRRDAHRDRRRRRDRALHTHDDRDRSEEHTSELQSRQYLVCRLLLDKKNSVAKRAPYSASY